MELIKYAAISLSLGRLLRIDDRDRLRRLSEIALAVTRCCEEKYLAIAYEEPPVNPRRLGDRRRRASAVIGQPSLA